MKVAPGKLYTGTVVVNEDEKKMADGYGVLK